MDFFYFLVTSNPAWTTNFHDNYFYSVGFLYGTLGALAIGAIMSLIFYFGCCNNPNSAKSATKPVWLVFLIMSGVIAYFFADFVLIGNPETTQPGTVSFTEVNNQYEMDNTVNQPSQIVAKLRDDHNTITNNLRQGNDVAFDFDLTTALLAILFYFIVSLIVKRFTLTGKAIPMLKP